MPSGDGSIRLRMRSLGGCATCRTRHVKCDEGRPICLMCKHFGLQCGGYDRGIFFEPPLSGKEGIGRFRRPLYTEQEREGMTRWLVSSLGPKTALEAVVQVDEGCETWDENADVDIRSGPFGAFRLPQGFVNEPVVQTQSQDGIQLEEVESPEAHLPVESWSPSENPGALQLTRLFETTDDAEPYAIFDNLFLPTTAAIFELPFELYDQQLPPPLVTDSQVDLSLPAPTLLCPASTNLLPPDSIPLLNHYKTKVLALLTPFRHEKTPWHILFIPLIKNCLAALTLGETLDDASLTAFYGTLAISAFSLGGIHQSKAWVARGSELRATACGLVRPMLELAYQSPKQYKYKSVLMGLLAMVHLSMFVGVHEETDRYFLEAEKFIRLKGLNRKKSRKVRLLHHCYVFERLFHESTFACGTNARYRLQIQKDIEVSGLSVYSQDSLAFRLPSWKDFDQEMLRVKDQFQGENDLHLGKLGDFPPTLYPEIFGIPESLVQLLSLTIRLRREKDSLDLKGFMDRAKSIERRIVCLRWPITMQIAPSNHLTYLDQHLLGNMRNAMHQALIIYFYRHIYDVEAAILQETVVRVRDYLLKCEVTESTAILGSAGFVWPAFIAACEAESPDLQASFSNMFKDLSERTGLSSFTNTRQTIEQTWLKKSRAAAPTEPWLDFTRQGY